MEQEKNKNVVVVLLIVIIVILLALVVLMATGTIKFKSSNVDDNNQSSEIINHNNKEEIISTNSPQEFIEKLNETNFVSYSKCTISYSDIKFVTNREYGQVGYNYKIFFRDTKINDEDIGNNRNMKFYLLNEDIYESFLVVDSISSGPEYNRYHIMSFDFEGNILLTDTFYSLDNVEITKNSIKYTFEKVNELTAIKEKKEDICKYLDNEYEDNYILNGIYTYEYSKGEIVLTDKKENTIENYKEKYNCS